MSNAGPVMRTDNSEVIPSKEEGFIGTPETWFDGKYQKDEIFARSCVNSFLSFHFR